MNLLFTGNRKTRRSNNIALISGPVNNVDVISKVLNITRINRIEAAN